MNRRRLLGAVAGGFAGIGGCLSGRSAEPAATSTSVGDDSNGTPTDREGGPTGTVRDESTPEETPAADGILRSATVTPAVVALDSPDSIGTYGDRDEQYVIAKVDAGSSGPGRGAFALETRDRTFEPVERIGNSRRRVREHGEAYESGGEGWIAFSVPNPLDAAGATVTWPEGEFVLPGGAIERLERPPAEFEIREFDAPDPVEAGEEAVATLTVANVGETDGTFVGALNRTGPWIAYTPAAAVSLDVPAGGTASRSHAHTPEDRDDEEGIPPMTFRLNWRGGSLSQRIEVEPG